MAHESTASTHDYAAGMWRWLLGGLLGGGAVLGLLIAAYAIGYHRGRDNAKPAPRAAAPAATVPAATTTAAAVTTSAAPAVGPVPVTAALVGQGRTLYSSDNCAGCHSLTGSPGAGPSFKGLAGSAVTLTTGRTITADDAYLQRSIDDPDAEIVKGYAPGIMPSAIASFGLAQKPDDVRALVAFIKSQK
jgi:mono/diheme cytochrome c family protein